MALLILLAFILVPIVEIALFIEIGGWIGLWPTLAVVVLTAFAGTALLRAQGLATLQRGRETLARNELPVKELFDGMCLLFAGALLLTPGFLTDSVGLLLFVPAVRAGLRRLLWRYMQTRGEVEIWVDGERVYRRDGTIIEGEYEEVHPERPRRDDDSDGAPPRIRGGRP